MRTLIKWLIRRRDYIDQNPFTGLSVKDMRGTRNRRDPFNRSEIEIIFKSPVFTGAKKESGIYRLVQGDQIYQDSLYWVPLIAYYSGMRLNEICQLHLDDVKADHEFPHFDLNEQDGKRLKTASSIRRVPIHQTLIDLGLFSHVKDLREKGGTRLFPDLKPGPHGNHGFYFSKTFARLLRRLGLKRPGLCFHSFRHTFVDNCKEAGIERPIAMAICGHDSGRSAHDFYGSGYSLRVLSQEINRISPMFFA
jgi:integrase